MSRSRKIAAAGAAGLVGIGVAGVYAASLQVVAQGNLGSGSATVQASCTDTIASEPGASTYNPALKTFAFTSLQISGDLADCAYNNAKATVYNATTDEVLSTQTAPVTITQGQAVGGAFSIPLATPVSAGVSQADVRVAVLITAATTQGTVTNFNSSPGYYAIGLSWTAPTDTGGVPTTGYKIEYAVDNAGSPGPYTTYLANTNDPATSRNIYPLTPGTQYWFRVTAWNAYGLSTESAQVQMANGVVPYMAAGAPTSVSSTTGGSGQLNASWTAPGSSGFTPITGYRIEVRWDQQADNPSNWSLVQGNTGNTATAATLSGLVPGRNYYVRVATLNLAGAGSWGTSASATAAGS